MNRIYTAVGIGLRALVFLTLSLSSSLFAQSVNSNEHSGHHGAMLLDAKGMTMNSNSSELPRDCHEITARHEFTVRVGVAYAGDFAGNTYGMSQHEWEVKPCSLVTVTLVNEDEVRHQWMLHGLPRYLYPQGMFHLEAAGGESRTASFIVPGDNKTYLVHCDIAQHMEKGMKAQLVVGSGSGKLWSIPGVSEPFVKNESSGKLLASLLVISMTLISALVMAFIGKKQ